MTGWLPDIWCCDPVFNLADTDMLITLHLIFDTDTWHLIPDTWYLTLALDMLSLNTWYLISDTWRLKCYHLILDICYHLVLIHLTWCCDTWLDSITHDTCITLHIHDYHFYGELTWLLYCYQTSGTPEFLYNWTLVLLNLCIPCTITLVNSTVIQASDGACLVSGWRGSISRSC